MLICRQDPVYRKNSVIRRAVLLSWASASLWKESVPFYAEMFFQGRRVLFKGLYADSMNWDWHSYPVLYLDLNIEKYQRTDNLREVIESLFRDWEKEYGAVSASESIAVRFREIIKSAHEKTGERVVVLVDEYDKPLVNNLHNREMFEFYRNELASLYSNFKSSAEHLRLQGNRIRIHNF